MDTEELKIVACKAIDDAAEDLNVVSKELWSHPELALKEHYAHDVLTKFMEKYKFPNIKKNLHLETAFSASYGQQGNGPHVMVMSEYDALPDIGHACGHNLIAEVGIATGVGIKAAMEKSKCEIGKLTVLGTPAEEVYGGKNSLIEAGELETVDVAMMAHPSKYAVLRPNYLAIKEMTIDFIGVESHSAEWPWQGVNALDAAVLCYNNLSCLRQQIPPGWMLHGIITNGGARPNIIPGKTSLEYYIRTANDKDLSKLENKVRKCVEGAAIATGCEFEVKAHSYYQTLLSNNTMIKLYEENGSKLGLEIERSETINKKLGGSTDMGNVSHVVPSIHPEFVIGSNYNSHTSQFNTAAGDMKAQPYTLITAKALAMTAIDVLTKPDLLPQIKKDFHAALEKEKQDAI